MVFLMSFTLLLVGCGNDNDEVTPSTDTSISETRTSPNTISGVVDDDPVEGAEVYIDFEDGTYSKKAITNADGSYKLTLSDEDLIKINLDEEGEFSDSLLIIASKDNRILRNALTRDVTDGQTVYITNDTEAYAQYLESIGMFDKTSLREFNNELENGRIKDSSDNADFIKDIREDVKTYFYGGEKPTASKIFSSALYHLGSDEVSMVADDRTYVPVRSIMSGGDVILGNDLTVTSDDVLVTSLGGGRYTIGDGSDSSGIVYLQIKKGDIFKLIPIELQEKIVTLVAQETITPNQGGTIGTELDSISASIPPFALEEEKYISFSKIESKGETTEGIVLLDMQPSGLTFEVPITIQIKYTDFGVEDPDTVEWKYGSSEEGYEEADIVSLDKENGYIYLSVTHFSELIISRKELPIVVGQPFEEGNAIKFSYNGKDYLNANNNGAHLGVDIMKNAGENIKAVCSGEVIKNESSLSSKSDVWIRSFVIKCDGVYEGKSVYAVYFHSSINNSFESVNNLNITSDFRVSLGDDIATVADLQTNSHLHLGFSYTDNRPQIKDTICINKNAIVDNSSSSYEEGYVNFNLSNSSYRFSKKDDNGNGSCNDNEYKIIAGGGIASSTELSKEIILPNEILTDLGWINPTDLLGGTSIKDYDQNIWDSSLVDLGNSELSYPFTSDKNKYELYLSQVGTDVRINLGSHNTDTDHLVTTSIYYNSDYIPYYKLQLQSEDQYNNTTGFTLSDSMEVSSDSDLNDSKLLVIPQRINIRNMVFKDSLSETDLFNDNENTINLTPFILDKNETSASSDLSGYGGDILSLEQNDSIYFPLKHIGSHKFYLRLPNSNDTGKLDCSYIRSDSDSEPLAINESETESVYSFDNWYMLGEKPYDLNGNGYLKCTATENVTVDALYVKNIDYSADDELEINFQVDLNDADDISDVELKIVIFDITNEDARSIIYQGVHNPFEASQITLPKSEGVMKLKGFVMPMSSTGSSSLLYNAIPFNIEDIEDQTSVTLAKITLQKRDMFKSAVKVRVVNATDASVISNASVIVKYGNDNLDGSTIYSETTNDLGEVEFIDVPYGEYTFILSKDGYISTSLNLTVSEGMDESSDLSMSPELEDGEFQIRLSWGATPRDLDSHLVKETDGVENYHIYYSHRTDTNTGDSLDLDDVDGEGPETITISAVDPDSIYTYYVHNFSGDDAGKIKDSGASVLISTGNSEEAPIYPIAGGEGEYWKVFTIENGVYKKCEVDCMGTTESTMFRSYSLFSLNNEADLFKNLPAK